MSNFLKMVSSNNFISTIDNEKLSPKHTIQNQQINSSESFRQMEIKEVKKSPSSTQMSIANMLFI